MIVFTVHEPPNPPLDRIERAERLEFVRDGFAPFAAVLPPVWMVINRLWLVLLLYLLAWLGVDLLLALAGVDKSLIGLINLAANVVVGFEASSLIRWTLARRGWQEVGTVVGRNRAECERRFFDGWLVEQPLMRRSSATAVPSVNVRRAASAVATAGIGGGAVEAGTGNHPFDGSPASFGSEPPYASRPSLWRRLLRR